MSDVYDKQEDLLEQIAGNIIDVKTAIGTTNELLVKILEALPPGSAAGVTWLKPGTILTDAYGNEFYVGRDGHILYPNYNRDETKELGELREKVKTYEELIREKFKE